jgi:hypothetical protein
MSVRHPLRALPVFVAGALSVLLIAGCGWSGQGRYTPTEDEARRSLEAALTAWREGRSSAQIEANPPVRVVDSVWLAGQQVDSFQILGESSGDYGTRRFTVRLSLKKPRGDREVQYIVHGRNPVWVYREDDYQRAMNMDNNPAPPQPKPKRRRR